MIVNRMPVLAIWIALGATLRIGVTDCMSAPAIQGTATVIDGDTIEIGGERIRLDAVDAPESSQLCLDAAGKRYRCGQKSAFALADMIGRSVVSCAPKGRDRYNCHSLSPFAATPLGARRSPEGSGHPRKLAAR